MASTFLWQIFLSYDTAEALNIRRSPMCWNLFQDYMKILNQIWPLILLAIPTTRDPNALYLRKEGAGAKRTDNRILVNTILYGLMTKVPWNTIFPDKSGYLCRGKTAHKWLMIWNKKKFFNTLLQSLPLLVDAHSVLQIKWISIDGTLSQTPFGDDTGQNPTEPDDEKKLCGDENSIVVALVHKANVHDCNLLEKTLKALQPLLPEDKKIHICLDTNDVAYEERIRFFGFIPHISDVASH